MGEADGTVRRELGDAGTVDVQDIDDPRQRGVDGGLDVGRPQTGKRRGEIGQEMLEPQTRRERALGRVPPPSLDEQAADQRRFDGDDPEAGDQRPPIELPERRLAEADDAARRQRRLRDAEAGELASVEHVRAAHVVRAVARPERLAAQDPQRELGRLHAVCGRSEQPASHDAVSEERFEQTVDRPRRYRGHPFDRGDRPDGSTDAVADDRANEDDRSRRQAAHFGQQGVQRQPRQMSHLDTRLVHGEIATRLRFPGTIQRTSAVHDDDPAGIGMQAERKLERRGPIGGRGHRNRAGAERRLRRAFDAEQHHGHIGKDRGAPLEHEVGRAAPRDDHVGLRPCIFFGQQSRELWLQRRPRGAAE